MDCRWYKCSSVWCVCFYQWLLDGVLWSGVWRATASSVCQAESLHHSAARSHCCSVDSAILPGMSWDCCSGFGFCVSHRYYLKNNMETETLCSDEDAQELLRESQISLLQLSTVEVATQLSMRNFELFRNIEPTEYIDDLFKLKSKTSCANLKTFEEVINQETFWVASEILRETNQLKRMKIIKHFIKIALHCRECKNFNSMFAIIRWEHVHRKSRFSLQVKKYMSIQESHTICRSVVVF